MINVRVPQTEAAAVTYGVDIAVARDADYGRAYATFVVGQLHLAFSSPS